MVHQYFACALYIYIKNYTIIVCAYMIDCNQKIARIQFKFKVRGKFFEYLANMYKNFGTPTLSVKFSTILSCSVQYADQYIDG